MGLINDFPHIHSISNAIITALASCRGLLSLVISDLQPQPTADADEAALVQLLRLQHLQQLTLTGFPALSIVGVAALATLPRLTQLTVINCDVCPDDRAAWLDECWQDKHVEVCIELGGEQDGE
eukprot:jgi/Chrzof1/1663/Cz10g16110.t1